MDGLGRVFNVLPVAADTYVSLRDASAVSFVCVNAAGETWTLTEADDTGGGNSAVLATLDHYNISATVGAVWSAKLTQAAASTIVTTSSQDVLVVTVHESELSDGKTAIKLTPTGSGTVVAFLHDLKSQRAPANLPALV